MIARCLVAAAAPALLGLTLAAPVRGQSPDPAPSLAVLPVHFSAGAAFQVDEEDQELTVVADKGLWASLEQRGRFALVDPARVREAIREQEPGPNGCTTRECVLAVGGQAGADLVLVTELTKLSNLIWFIGGQLVDVRTGEVIHTEELELKGVPVDMVRGGVASLARRMGGAVKGTGGAR